MIGVGGDANSYYKNIRLPYVLAAADFFTTLAFNETGESSVTLLKSAHLQGFVGGSIESRARNRIVVLMAEMRQGLEFEIGVAGVFIMCELIIRLRFPGMGALLSEIVCSLVASHFECVVRNSCENLIFHKILPPGSSSTESWLQSIGHVGDLLTVTKSHCASCTHLYQQSLLPARVGYGRKQAGILVKFLHAMLLFSEEHVDFAPTNPNLLFALGLSARQTRARGRPNVGFNAWTRTELRGFIRQRLSAHRQTTKNDNEVSLAVLYLADKLLSMELEKLGYSKKALYAVWRGIPPGKTDDAIRIVRDELKQGIHQEK